MFLVPDTEVNFLADFNVYYYSQDVFVPTIVE